MVLIARFARGRYTRWFGGLAVASLLLSIISLNVRPAATFFLAPTRAWELLAGALIATSAVPSIKNTTAANVAGWAGLLCILTPVLTYSAETPFPGVAALPPVIGTALLVYVGVGQPTLVSSVLSSRGLGFLGRISYSWYLWHWPLLILADTLTLGTTSKVQRVGVVGVSLGLAILTRVFVEEPLLRRTILATRQRLFAAAASAALAMFCFGAAAMYTRGIPARFPTDERRMLQANDFAKSDWQYPDECQLNFRQAIGRDHPLAVCEVEPAAGNATLFWGDSQIEQLYSLVRDMAGKTIPAAHRVVFVTSGGCPPIPGLLFTEAANHCASFNAAALRLALSDSVSTVVIGSLAYGEAAQVRHCGDVSCSDSGVSVERTSDGERLLTHALQQLAAAGKHVVLILPFPTYEFSPPDYLNRAIVFHLPVHAQLTPSDYVARTGKYREMMLRSARAVGATVVDPAAVYCSHERCIWREGMVSLYKDGAHLTARGTLRLRESLSNALSWRDSAVDR
jgi:hypothetical protein